MSPEFLTFSELRLWLPVLDEAQLRADRLRAKQILMNLEGKAWNRPAEAARWQGFEGALALLGLKLCMEYRRRHRLDPLFSFFALRIPREVDQIEVPEWML